MLQSVWPLSEPLLPPTSVSPTVPMIPSMALTSAVFLPSRLLGSLFTTSMPLLRFALEVLPVIRLPRLSLEISIPSAVLAQTVFFVSVVPSEVFSTRIPTPALPATLLPLRSAPWVTWRRLPSFPAPWRRFLFTSLPPPYWTRIPALGLAEIVFADTEFPLPQTTTPTPAGFEPAAMVLLVSELPSVCR